MILRRQGGGSGRGRGTGCRSHAASADDGKRFVDVPSGTSCAERFMSQERDDIEKIRGRVREGERLGMTGSALSMYLQVQAALNVSCRKKEMILRRLGGGSGRGRGSGLRSPAASADF